MTNHERIVYPAARIAAAAERASLLRGLRNAALLAVPLWWAFACLAGGGS